MMKKETSFETQMKELEAIVQELSTSNDLEAALKKFERGLELAEKATKRLNAIENRLVEIKVKFALDPQVYPEDGPKIT